MTQEWHAPLNLGQKLSKFMHVSICRDGDGEAVDMEEDELVEQLSPGGVGVIENVCEAMPTMSVSVDIEHLRSQWRKRKRPGGDEKGIATFQAASVKV